MKRFTTGLQTIAGGPGAVNSAMRPLVHRSRRANMVGAYGQARLFKLAGGLNLRCGSAALLL